MNALTPLGMVSDLPSENQTREAPISELPMRELQMRQFGIKPQERGDYYDVEPEQRSDYFVERDGMRFAGTHLLIDLWGASNLSDPGHIDAALREAAITAGATILHSHFHHFTPNGGVSGVVVLAESHISIHTWPERDFAAVDIFMCGVCDPRDAIPVLDMAFAPLRVDIEEKRRGRVA